MLQHEYSLGSVWRNYYRPVTRAGDRMRHKRCGNFTGNSRYHFEFTRVLGIDLLDYKEINVAVQAPGTARPVNIVLHQQSRVLEVEYEDGQRFELPCEYLRVYSPSAEVRGHGPGQETLQVGKREVNIVAIEPVGSYAIKLVFSDGHDTGLYSWDYLYELGNDHEVLWKRYLDRMALSGASRDPKGEVKVHKLKAHADAPRFNKPPTDE